MKSQRYIVTTSIKGRVLNRVWDASQPLALDYPFRFVIENTPVGLRVRELGSENQSAEFKNVQCVKITPELISKGSVIQLKPTSGGPLPTPMQLQVRALTSIIPLSSPSRRTLAAGDGVSISACLDEFILNSGMMQGEYTARIQSRSVFKVIRKGSSFEFQVGASEVETRTVRTRGSRRESWKAGESKVLDRDALVGFSIHSGKYSWHFTQTAEPEGIPPGLGETDIETSFFKRTLAIGILFLLGATGISLLVAPSIVPPVVEKPVPQEFKITLPKKKIESGTKIGVQAPEALKDSGGAPEEPSRSEKVTETPAPKAESKTAAAVPKKTEAKPVVAPPKNVRPPTRAKLPGTEVKKGPSARAMRMQSMISGMLEGSVGNLVKQDSLVKQAGSAGTGKMDLGTSVGGLTSVGVGAQHLTSNTGVGTLGGDGGGGEADGKGGGGGGGGVGYGKGTQAGFGGKGVAGIGGEGKGISLDVANAAVDEGLTKEEVGEVIHKHWGEVRYCYEASMLRTSRVEGKLNVAFTINGKGIVKTAGVQSSNIQDGKLQDCIVRRLQSWKFPLPRGGVNVDVTYPFIFKTLGGG